MLSDERIEELILAGGGRWHDKSFWKIEDADLHPTARAIEAEVRKQDEALIRQLVGALEAAVLQNDCDMAMTGEELRQSRSVITLGRARLEGKPCD